MASAPLPVLADFTFSHSHPVNFAGCPPAHLMWELLHRARGSGLSSASVVHRCPGILPLMLPVCSLGGGASPVPLI